ncbi:MAG TPA: DnaJ domain-containing protein [Chryseolinea sp.]|nr:DnaJ domain-containing protein [Chryseolinea sp.]
MNKDYYQIFGLPSNCTDEEIKKTYRKLAIKFHPDKNSNDKYFEERFKELQEAYEVLSDPVKRKNYNLKTNRTTSQQPPSNKGSKKEESRNEGTTPDSIAADVEDAYRKIKWSEPDQVNHIQLIKYIDSILNENVVAQLLRIGDIGSNERIVDSMTDMFKFLSKQEIGKYVIPLVRLAGTNNELISKIHKIEKAERRKEDIGNVFFYLKMAGGIAFFLGMTYFLLIKDDKSKDSTYSYSPNTIVDTAPELEPPPSKFKGNKLKTGDSPYNDYFGKGVYDKDFQNQLTVKNGQQLDVIVCLVEYYSGKRTIRNEYIRAGESFVMTNVPNGTYLLKSFYGKDWNPNTAVNAGTLKGYFETNSGFSVSDSFDDLIKMEQTEESYSIYSVTLYPVVGGNMESRNISAEDFFKNN